MKKKREFKTEKKRPSINTSNESTNGLRSCNDSLSPKTGGECIIVPASKYYSHKSEEKFYFYRKQLSLEELFDANIGMIAFGGYIYSEEPVSVGFNFSYKTSTTSEVYELKSCEKNLIITDYNSWNPVGLHNTFNLDIVDTLYDLKLTMLVKNLENTDNILQFIGFDFDVVNYSYYKENKALKPFNQKTAQHIPSIYYLDTTLKFDKYLLNNKKEFVLGDHIVLKGCNRCRRYLPININNETNKLSFSFHCSSKKSPCKHGVSFRQYKIDNLDYLKSYNLNFNYIKDNNVISYHGHQLECTSCKKFFVNNKLNNKRSKDQRSEDSSRRRSIEVLVNTLLNKNIAHFEYKQKTKQEFCEYIWNKFNRKCFKCGKKLELHEMHVDHTMPLAYLYRLDESATCLCSTHNSKKNDTFPIEFYSKNQLLKLSQITGLDLDTLSLKIANPIVVELLIKNITWFFDEFLLYKENQKLRKGKFVANQIYNSISKVIGPDVNLIDEYYKLNNKYPASISLK